MAIESDWRAGDQPNPFAPSLSPIAGQRELESVAWIDQNAAPRLPRRYLG